MNFTVVSSESDLENEVVAAVEDIAKCALKVVQLNKILERKKDNIGGAGTALSKVVMPEDY